MKTVVDIAIPVITFLLLVAVGLDLTRQDFVRLARKPRLIVAGLIGPLVLLPPIAVALVSVADPPEHLAAGLLLIAICPVGGISNTYSYLARASTALSVTLTGLSCLLATVTIPALTVVFEAVLGRPLGLSVPARLLFAQLLVVLAAPISLGMVIRHRWPAAASRHERGLRQAGFGGLGLLIVFVVVSQGTEFARYLALSVLLSASFIAASGLAGLVVGRFAARERADRFTLAVEFATRNVAIATAVAVTLAGRIEMAVFATTYFLTEVPIMLAAVTLYRRVTRLHGDRFEW
jgi:bile acid:Na+ symporter, BASS family